MPLPKVHPLTKTYIDLRRCAVRLDEFLAKSDVYEMPNEFDNYLKMYESIVQIMDMVPEEYRP